MRRRRTIRTSQIVQRRRRLFFIKTGLFFLFLILLFFGLWSLLRSNFLSIQRITVLGENFPEEEIKNIARSDMSGYYFHFVSKSNVFFYPKEKIRQDILERFERVEDANVGRDDFNTMKISLTERKTAYLWCGNDSGVRGTTTQIEQTATTSGTTTEALSVEKVEHCFSIDKEGFVFENFKSGMDTKYFKFYGPLLEERMEVSSTSASTTEPHLTSFENAVGSYFLELNEFENLLNIIDDLEKSGITVASARFQGGKEIHLKTKAGYVLRVRVLEDPLVLVQNLQSVLHSDVFEGPEGKEKLSNLSYIDLRFGNKIFYR